MLARASCASNCASNCASKRCEQFARAGCVANLRKPHFIVQIGCASTLRELLARADSNF